MAVNHYKSTVITNLDATPPVKPAVEDMRGRLKVIPFTAEFADNDDIGSTLRIGRVHTDHRVLSIMIFCDTLTGGAADIGLYRTAADGGAVVDVDAYASAQTIATANRVGIECAFEARDINKMLNYVWQDGGYTTNPNYDLDIALTLTAQITDPGTLSGYIVLEDRT